MNEDFFPCRLFCLFMRECVRFYMGSGIFITIKTRLIGHREIDISKTAFVPASHSFTIDCVCIWNRFQLDLSIRLAFLGNFFNCDSQF
ncbi:hypothetical protein KR100_14180 [Synechococcus sp. KORDI-100]|nr:hypothetical protein KR100_14180 [Synechococcus sp. KORDI-100]